MGKIISIDSVTLDKYSNEMEFAKREGYRTIGNNSISQPIPDRIKPGKTLECRVVGKEVTILRTETEKGKFAICLISVTEGKDTFNVSFTTLPKEGEKVNVEFTEYNGRTYGKIV